MYKCRFFFCALAFVLALGGCSVRNDETTAASENMIESIDYEVQYRNQADNDLLKGEWKREEITDTKQLLSLTEYRQNLFVMDEAKGTAQYNRGRFADTNHIYSLDLFYPDGEDGNKICNAYLNILDINTKETRVVKYSDSDYASRAENPYAVGGRVFAAGQSIEKDDSPSGYRLSGYYIVELKEDGTIALSADVVDIVKSHRLISEQAIFTEAKLYYEPYNNRLYVITPTEDRMYVADAEGKEIPDLESGEAGTRIALFTTTEDGRLIFIRSKNGQTTCFYFEGDEKKILFEAKNGPEYYADGVVSDVHGRLIFAYNGGTVVSWDTATGVQEKLFEGFGDEHSYSNYRISVAARNEAGEILTLEKNDLRIFSASGAAQKVTITLKPFMYSGDNLVEPARQYEKIHPGVSIKIEPVSEWENRDRDMMQMVQEIAEGGGPDILWISREQMLQLDKNDCLRDVSDILTDSVKATLFPGVLDYGRTDNGIKLLAKDPFLQTLFVNRNYLHNSTWTVQDVLAIIEKKEAAGKPFEALGYGLYDPFYLFITGLYDSEFIDVEAGSCSFDTPLFERVLETCKRYNTHKNYAGIEEAYQLLKQDKILVCAPTGMGIHDYSEACAILGEEYVAGGYPSISGNGNHICFDDGFAVNRNADNIEVISDFINWMYSMNSPNLINHVPVREDAFEGRILYPNDTTFYDTPVIQIDSQSYLQIEARPDGSTYVDQYIELVKNCRYDVKSMAMNKISKIILEEIEVFYAGDRTAAETARIIQSRVSLYLMENQ